MASIGSRNILFVLPSMKWNTKERRAIKDMTQARDHGYNVVLMAQENSFVAEIGKEHGFEIIYIKNHVLNRLTNFHKHISLSLVFKKYHLDIVHFYDSYILCSIALQLKPHHKTALVFTPSSPIDKTLKFFWYRPFINRLDSLLLSNKNLVDDAQGNLGLEAKKIEYFGNGIRFDSYLKESDIEVNFDLYSDYFLAATYVSPGGDSHNHLMPILHALKVINQKSPAGQQSKLILISPIDFQTFEYLPTLMKEIQELNLEEDVLFVSTKDIPALISHFDLWISNSPDELIEDHALCALTHEVPVILTRNFCSKELLAEYEGVGESYKIFDARELRVKWEQIMMSKSVYFEKTRLYKFFIEREHSFKNYRAQLMSVYSRSISRRIRELTKNR